MTTLKLDAYIPSKGEYEKYFDKFRAFMSADLSEKAKEQNAFCSSSYNGKGWYPLRSALSGSASRVFCGDINGSLGWINSHNFNAGMRVAFKVIYNPDSSLVKGCRTEKRTTLVYDEKKEKNFNVTSSAPIVKFGGKDCIWLNKEDCESGKSKEMELWTLDLIERAVPFDREGKTDDFAKATELIAQCDRVLKENCTKEELKMIIPVKMSSEDNYEKTTSIIKNKEEITVKDLFNQVSEGEITVEELRAGLKGILNRERKRPGVTQEDAIKLGQEIASEAKKLEEKLAEKEKVEATFKEVDSQIDSLGI